MNPLTPQVNKDLALKRAREVGAKNTAAANVNQVKTKTADEVKTQQTPADRAELTGQPPVSEAPNEEVQQHQQQRPQDEVAQAGGQPTGEVGRQQTGEVGAQQTPEHPAVGLQRKAADAFAGMIGAFQSNLSKEEQGEIMQKVNAAIAEGEKKQGSPATPMQQQVTFARVAQEHALNEFQSAPDGSPEAKRWEAVGLAAHQYRETQGEATRATEAMDAAAAQQFGANPGPSAGGGMPGGPTSADGLDPGVKAAQMHQDYVQTQNQIRQIWLQTYLDMRKSMMEMHKMLRDYMTWNMQQTMESTLLAAQTKTALNQKFSQYLTM